jgi:cytochrome b subunit of formate dehydrogenase
MKKKCDLLFRKCLFIFCASLILAYIFKGVILLVCVYTCMISLCVDAHTMVCILSQENSYFMVLSFHLYLLYGLNSYISLVQQGYLPDELSQWQRCSEIHEVLNGCRDNQKAMKSSVGRDAQRSMKSSLATEMHKGS